MARRKGLIQALQQEVEPPGPGQHIVRAVGSRGSNIIEVEFPEGRATLALLPAKFHKKLWIKRGTYLVVEDASEEVAEDGGRVTAQILAVLYEDHVKQLKRMHSVWPPQFADDSGRAAAGSAAASLEALSLGEGGAARGSGSGAAAAGAGGESDAASSAGEGRPPGESGYEEDSSSSSEDDLPPIERIQNRRVVHYEVSESESDDEG
eukprot:scaffold2.g7364.t1